MFKSQLKF